MLKYRGNGARWRPILLHKNIFAKQVFPSLMVQWVAKLPLNRWHIVWLIVGVFGVSDVDILLRKKMHRFSMMNLYTASLTRHVCPTVRNGSIQGCMKATG